MRTSLFGHFVLVLVVLTATPLAAVANETIVPDQPQVAGISGFRAFWDTPVVLAEDGPVVETQHTPGGPHMLILDTKGFDPLNDVRKQAADRWVRAVNADGTYGAGSTPLHGSRQRS